MASKVFVKLPTVPFSQGKKPPPELVAVARNEPTMKIRHPGGGGDRAAQFEQNMKFLQDQHRATLVALHQEVETLRQRNRDLQFQLIFSKDTVGVVSLPSSPEDNVNGFANQKGSPLCVNVTPLQVELLERDLKDLKTSLQEAKAHNHYLSGIIDQQKIKVDLMEHRRDEPLLADVGVQVGIGPDAVRLDLAARLEDAEAIVQCLRRENEDQRREISTMKAIANRGNGSGTGRSRGNNGHHGRGMLGNGGQEQNSYKFPPLQSQSYWHHGSRGNNGFDHNSDYHCGRSRQDKQGRDSVDGGGTVLPQLRNGGNRAESSGFQPFHRSRGYHNNGNGGHYREGGNRKYRGQRSQKDCKEREPRDQHRDFKGRDPKDQQREYKDSAQGSRDSHISQEP